MTCEANKNINCKCTYSCSRHGKCCECIAYHGRKNEFTACQFSDEAERKYDRSFDALVKDRSKQSINRLNNSAVCGAINKQEVYDMQALNVSTASISEIKMSPVKIFKMAESTNNGVYVFNRGTVAGVMLAQEQYENLTNGIEILSAADYDRLDGSENS